MTDVVETVTDGSGTAAARRVLQQRLADYAHGVSFDKGKRPDPLLSDAERGDLATTEADWGVPCGILLLVDRMMTMISPAARVDFARALRDAAPARGWQARGVGAFVVWLLADPTHGAQAVVRHDGVAAAIAAVIDAQRRTLAGETLARADWSAIRKIAITGSDAARDGRASHFAALCAEAAAWPPGGSASVGVQTLEPWSNIAGGVVDAEQGWTLADYDRLQTVMKAVWDASSAARAAGDQPDLDAGMQAEAPELATRWKRHVDRTRALSATRMAAACEALVHILKAPQP